MIILAIDPGITTGYARVECSPGDPPRVLEWGNILEEDLHDSYFEVVRGHLFPIDVIVIEKTAIVSGKLQEHLNQINAYLHGKFPKATWVTPGVWKNDGRVQKGPLPTEPSSRHQKDAYQLAYWASLNGVTND